MNQISFRYHTKFILALSLLLILSLLSLPLAKAQDEARAAWQVASFDIAANVLQSERALTAIATLSIKNVGRGPGSGLTLRC